MPVGKSAKREAAVKNQDNRRALHRFAMTVKAPNAPLPGRPKLPGEKK
jgi:hypothetical protein